jgi:hypothetical protein
VAILVAVNASPILSTRESYARGPAGFKSTTAKRDDCTADQQKIITGRLKEIATLAKNTYDLFDDDDDDDEDKKWAKNNGW